MLGDSYQPATLTRMRLPLLAFLARRTTPRIQFSDARVAAALIGLNNVLGFLLVWVSDTADPLGTEVGARVCVP
jgi:hypothetical protein